MINNLSIGGRLTRDPELRQLQNGTYLVKFSIANNQRVPDGSGGWKDEASFFDVVMFGNRAEKLANFFRKGRPILLCGKLEQQRWQDKDTGANRSKIQIVAWDWHFCPKDDSARDDGGSPPAGSPGGNGAQGHKQGSMLDGDDDVPF